MLTRDGMLVQHTPLSDGDMRGEMNIIGPERLPSPDKSIRPKPGT